MHKVLQKDKYNKFVNNSLSAFAKLGSNAHLSALRDGFAMMTPLMITGALGVVFIVFIFGGWGSNNASFLGIIARIHIAFEGIVVDQSTASVDALKAIGLAIDSNNILSFAEGGAYAQASSIGASIFGPLWDATIGAAIGIYSSFAIGYFYARTKGSNQPVIAGLIALAAFFLMVGFDKDMFGPKGSLIAIIAAFASMEAYCALEKNEKLLLKLPAGVPPAVAVSFSKLFPAMIVLSSVTILNTPFIVLSQTLGVSATSLGHAVYAGIQAPFESLAADPAGQLSIGVLFIGLVGLFWFFGLHGSNILDGAVNPIWFVLLALNTEALANGEFPEQAMSKGFWDAYVYIGGTGATLMLLLATLIFSRRQDTREIAKFSIPAGLFQINEPVTFGYPMVMNTTFFVPYVFTMPILTVIAWLAISVWQIVPGGIVAIPWSTPMILGAFLHTGAWQSILLALVNMGVAFLIWLPFVFIYNRQAAKSGIAPVQSWADKIVKFAHRFEVSEQVENDKAQIQVNKAALAEVKKDYELDEATRLAKVDSLKEQIASLSANVRANAESNKEYASVLKTQIKTAKAGVDKEAIKTNISAIKQEFKAKIADISAPFDNQIKDIYHRIGLGWNVTDEEYEIIKNQIATLKQKHLENHNLIESKMNPMIHGAVDKNEIKKFKFEKQNQVDANDNMLIDEMTKIKDGKYIDGYLTAKLEGDVKNLLAEKAKALKENELAEAAAISDVKAKYNVEMDAVVNKYKTFMQNGVKE